MIGKITVGQYYNADSPIHRLDPRIKLLSVFAFITLLFVANSFAGYLFAAACLFTVIFVSKVPFRLMFRGLRTLIFILAFTAALNIFFTPGETVIFQFWIIKMTLEGILFASKMCFRLILLIIGSSVLTLTTSPIQLTDAIEYILKPFRKIGVPSHEIAMMMTIALRFIPILSEELDKIMKAQIARGADFDTGGIIRRAKNLIPLLVPLFISAIRRADELATAMEARCYRGGGGRTKLKVMRLARRDGMAVCLIFLFASGIITIKITGLV